MIPVARIDTPAILRRNRAKWTTELLAEKDPAKRKKIVARYAHPQIRKTLEKMFHGKCAFCESQIDHISYSEIEHFWPKAERTGYPQKTFEWENLFLSCRKCNGSKSDYFPLSQGNPILINPCDDNPDDHLLFDYDETTGFSFVHDLTSRGIETVKTYSLNRETLIKSRSEVLKSLFYLAIMAQKGDSKALSLLEDACADSSQYAAFARSLKKKFEL